MLDEGFARAFVSDQPCFNITLGFNVLPRVGYGLPFLFPLVVACVSLCRAGSRGHTRIPERRAL